MARPERNTVDYYPHIPGEGKKMYFIDKKYGNDGYATWFKILDKLALTEHHYLDLNKEEEIMFLASKCNITDDRLLSIIDDLVKLGKFNKEMWEFNIIWDQSFIDSIQEAYKKRSNKCITLTDLRILLTSLGVLNKVVKPLKGDVKPQTKLKDTIVEESKGDIVVPSATTLYASIIEFWLKEFHIGWTFTAQHGKEIKSIITKIKGVLKNGSKDVTDLAILESFKAICNNLPEWYKDKDLAIINSKFNEVVSEIKNHKNGKSITSKQQQSKYAS
jgi:hypothetical protein